LPLTWWLEVEVLVMLHNFGELKNLDVSKSRKHGLLRKYANSSYFRKEVAEEWVEHMRDNKDFYN
jgi:hypothetical protein